MSRSMCTALRDCPIIGLIPQLAPFLYLLESNPGFTPCFCSALKIPFPLAERGSKYLEIEQSRMDNSIWHPEVPQCVAVVPTWPETVDTPHFLELPLASARQFSAICEVTILVAIVSVKNLALCPTQKANVNFDLKDTECRAPQCLGYGCRPGSSVLGSWYCVTGAGGGQAEEPPGQMAVWTFALTNPLLGMCTAKVNRI
ncbi:hypothetical protein B0H12DRAFT_1078965 [Mycena haematopus]|nr:hypothetical protein B0H12DRAFT_1078965 [Mycena haematopus]